MNAPENRGMRGVVLPMIGLRSSARSYVMALVCYLDDSGTDPQCPYVVMAGYLTTLDSWQVFEAEAAKVMERYGVTYIRGRDLFASDGDYEGWTFDQKVRFITEINAVLSPNIGIALTFACLKSLGRARQGASYSQAVLFRILLRDAVSRSPKGPAI